MDRPNQIVQLIQQKDEKGLSLLYDHYAPSLLGISYGIVNDKQIAEDILQKAMMKIWSNIDQYDSYKGAWFTWLSTIVRNLSIDMKRSKRYASKSKTTDLDSAKEAAAKPISTSKIDTDRLLKGIDEKYQVVLEYLYLKGYTQRELSDELDIPLGTIKTRLKKAVDLLRDNVSSEPSFLKFGKMLFLSLILILIP